MIKKPYAKPYLTMWKKTTLLKTLFVLFALISLQWNSSFAQAGRGITYNDTYSFASMPANGLTTVFTAADETITNAIGITGFTVSFGGRTYSAFHISSNGFIILTNATPGSAAPIGATPNNNLSAIPAGSGPLIAPLWDDLITTANYRVAGSAATGFVSVDWLNVFWDKSAATPYFARVQMRMYSSAHTTLAGQIGFYYQPINSAALPYSYGPYSGISGGASIGIADTCGGDYYSVGQGVVVANTPGWTNGTASKTVHTSNINNVGSAQTTLPQVQRILFDRTVPANDQCANAVNLGSIPAGACTPTIGTLIGATNTGTPAGPCDAGNTNDVWYRITKPANITSFRVTTDFAALCRGVTTSVEVYSGACGALVSIDCASTGGTINANNAVVDISDPANSCNSVEYYIRVAGDASAQGEFQICVENYGLSNCGNATVIPNTLPQTFTCQTTCGSGNDFNSTHGCNSSYMNGEDFVYTFTPAANVCVNINISNTGAGSNPGIFVLNNCPTVGGVFCVASNTASGNAVGVTGVNLAAGVTYYIVVSNNNTPACIPFDISITQAVALPPANDNPCQAGVPNLAVGGATCAWTNGGYSTNCASATSAPNPSCGNYNGADIWFTATIPGTGNILIDTRPGASNPMGDAAMAVYSAPSCTGPFTQIACANSGSSANALFPQISLTGRTPGETVWIRVWSENNASSGSIEFCLSTACIANDEPCGAILVPVTTGTPSFSTYDNTCATTSVGPPAVTCATAARVDVWYRIVVPPSGRLVFMASAGTMTDPVMQLYRSATNDCNSLSVVACNDDAGPGLDAEIRFLCGGIIPGETIWIRIWRYGTTGTGEGDFELAVYDPGLPVYEADEPCNITTDFPVTPGSCTNYINLSLDCMTITAGGGTPGIPVPINCDPFWHPGWWGGSNDMWVRVQVPAGITTMNFVTTAGSMTDDQMAVYRSTNCSTLTQLACDDLSGPGLMPYISLGGLVPGETLYIRHWGWRAGSSSAQREGDFGFCVETPCSTFVTNDNPCQAIPLAATASCIYKPYTTQCATNTSQPGTPATATCGFLTASSRDVWFSTVVPPSGQLSIDLRSINIPDAVMTVYWVAGGSCAGVLTLGEIACNDNSSTNPAMPYVLLNRTPGETLYIRVWAKNDLSGDFEICVVDQCPTGVPSNDLPCNAQPLTLGTPATGYNSCSQGLQEPYPPDGGGANPGCWANAGISELNTVWYSFVAPASGQVRIRTTLGTLTNTQIALYQGVCFSMTAIAGMCNDDFSQCGNPTQASELIATGLVPGSTYYVVVDGRNGLTGTFGITVYDNSIPIPPIAQQDCVLPTQICAQQTTIGAPGFRGPGNFCDLGTTAVAYGCVPATGARENNSAFFTFSIATTGNLFFDIVPTGGVNYDWVLWNISGQTITDACTMIRNNTMTIAACNYSTTTGTTGMQSTGTCLNCQTTDPPVSRDILVTAGQTYLLMINNTSGQFSGFTLDFGATSPVLFGSPPSLTWSGGNGNSWTDPVNWGGCGIPSCTTSANIVAVPPGGNTPVIAANEQVKNVFIAPGGSLTINAGVTLQICGSYTNLGSLIADPTSIIEFIGDTIQTINGNVTGPNRFGNLLINKSAGVVRMNTTVDVARDFTTQNVTSVFDCNGQNLRIGRNFNNINGTSTFQSPAGSTLSFIGGAPQTFTNLGSTLTLNNVTMAQLPASSVTLSPGPLSNMIIGTNGVLTLPAVNGGRIITGANEVIVTNTSGPAVTPGGNTSYVEGWLRRNFGTSIGSYDFPVGDPVPGYERATLEFTSPPSTPYSLVMRFLRWGGANLPLVNGVYPPLECSGYNWSLRQALNHGYWNTISSTATPTGTYNLTLYNRTYSNYVGTATPASVTLATSVAQGAPGTVLTFSSTATPGFPALTPGMNVLGFGVPPGATITAVTATTCTISAATTLAVPAGTYIDFFSAGATGAFAALTIMKDVNGAGNWTMEATCPCNPTYPPSPKPTSRRYLYDASNTGFFNFATVQFGTALPIELISFTADATEKGNVCQWVTASEVNNAYFILERSYDGENFVKIAQVNGYGAGTTTETREYSFTDEDPCNGVVYYKLRQVDIDGTESSSDIIALNCLKTKDALSVYPNPARSSISYSFFEESDGVINVQIVDMYGKIVSWERFGTQQGANTLQSNIEHLTPGVYYLKLDHFDRIETARQVRFIKN